MHAHMGANTKILEGGGRTARTDKNYLFVDSPEAQMTIIAVFRRYGLNLRIYASAEGAREKIWVFCTETTRRNLFKFKSGGGN